MRPPFYLAEWNPGFAVERQTNVERDSDNTEEAANGFSMAVALRLLGAFEIGSDSDSRLGSNFGNAVLIYLKLFLKVEVGLTSPPDLEVD